VAAECGIHVPSRDSLQEVETRAGSELRASAVHEHAPRSTRSHGWLRAPTLGFILSPELLVTVRYSEVHAFAEVKAHVEKDPHLAAQRCSLS